MTTVLTIDLGTGGPKVAFVNTEGVVLWWEHTTIATTLGEGGLATQDAGHWWEVIRAGISRGLRVVPAADVRAVAVTGQWASTVPVDAQGRPTGPCVMWLDERGGPFTRKAIGGPLMGYHPGRLATWVRRTGAIPTTTGADPVGHMLLLENDPSPATRWYLEPVDYLAMCFTRVPAATHASMTAAWLTDNRDLSAMAYDDDLVAHTGINPERLPPLVPIGSVIGPVHPEVAAELGLRPDTVVITGLPDLHAATVGSGGVGLGEGHASIGTTGWVSAPVKEKKTDLLHQMATVPGLDNNTYLIGNNQESAGRALGWFRDAVAPDVSFEDLLDEAGSAPVGAEGVMFTPWIAGERSPVENKVARGGFHNLSAETTRAHLTRAVIEGVAFNTRWLLTPTEKFVGHQMEPLRLVGGGARSDLWCQVMADVTGRTVVSSRNPLLAGVSGMALMAGIALGELAMGEVRDLVSTPRRFEPRAAASERYSEIYAEFPKLFAMQKGFFARMNR